MSEHYKSVEPLLYKTYLATIENSVGANTYRTYYAKVDGTEKDVMRNGDLSCAFFVSSILVMFGLIKRIHGTVGGTLKDMEKSGWHKIDVPKVGAVLIWTAEVDEHGESHKHIGFYTGSEMAISNSSKLGHPDKHPYLFRALEGIYAHPSLRD